MATKDDEIAISAGALESLERNFVEVMKELSAEDNMEGFKIEYEKLHRVLRKSHESEKRLIRKCQELNQEIVSNATKVQSALQLSQDDEATIASLRKEIEKAWKMVDTAHDKETKARDTIQQLRKEVNRLNGLVEQGSGLSQGHENLLRELIETRKELISECEASKTRVTQLQHELTQYQERKQRLDEEGKKVGNELQLLTDTYSKAYELFEKEHRRREVGEHKVQEYHKSIDKHISELDRVKHMCDMRVHETAALTNQKNDLKLAQADLIRQCELAQREFKSETEQLSAIETQNTLLRQFVPKKEAALEHKAQEMKALEATYQNVQQAMEHQEAEVVRLTGERDAIAENSPKLEQEITDLLVKLSEKQRAVEELERMVKDKSRNKSLIVNANVRDEQERYRLEGQRVIERGKNRSLAQELDSVLRSNEQLRKDIFLLERHQEKYFTDAQEASSRYQQTLEQMRQSREKTANSNSELQECQKKLKNQQSMYEQVRADRAQYSKSLNEAHAEIEDMMKRFKMMDAQIKQLKDEIGLKERQLCQSYAAHKQLRKDISGAEQRVSNLREDYGHAKGRAEALEAETKQLSQIIADCDTEKSKQQMKFNSVTNERNILSTQLIHRNEELALLYEKIRILQSTLSKGETEYRDRLIDIRMLRDRVNELRSGLRIGIARIKSVQELKRHGALLQRQLTHERTKVKALYEELQNPMNVHRWRRLEGSDPETMEKLLKIHTLQRRLIVSDKECTEKQECIDNKEREYGKLKKALARQPGPEVAQQLAWYHDNIVRRNEQIRQMTEELQETDAEAHECEDTVGQLHEEYLDLKKKYYDVKWKNTLLQREKVMGRWLGSAANAGNAGVFGTTAPNFVLHYPAKQPRYAGGGFALSQ